LAHPIEYFDVGYTTY